MISLHNFFFPSVSVHPGERAAGDGPSVSSSPYIFSMQVITYTMHHTPLKNPRTEDLKFRQIIVQGVKVKVVCSKQIS